MYATKGFVAHSQFPDNTVGTVAKIGEVSTQSLTYAQDVGEYVLPAVPGLTYHSFLSSENGTAMPVPAVMSAQVLAISAFIYNNTLTHAGQQYADQILSALTTQFAAQADTFASGAMITDGTYWVPEWVSWRALNLAGVDADNLARVWFVDGSFQLQYDEYAIVPVPPTARLDDFFKTGAEVDAFLSAITVTDTLANFQAAKSALPETFVRSQEYNYIDPYNPAHIVPTNWGILGYGQAGNNPDAISDELVNFILANSTHPMADWVKILPDLFKRTEMLAIPRWDIEAIPNRDPAPGIYSPVASLTSALTAFGSFAPSYPPAHINSYAAAVPHPYKGLSILFVGGPDNRNNYFQFTDLFGDYIGVSSQSLDFNRMSVYTKNFLLALESALLVAEVATKYSSIPQGYTRTTRDNLLYVVFNYDNINYLIATKSNFPNPTIPPLTGAQTVTITVSPPTSS